MSIKKAIEKKAFKATKEIPSELGSGDLNYLELDCIKVSDAIEIFKEYRKKELVNIKMDLLSEIFPMDPIRREKVKIVFDRYSTKIKES